MSKELPVKGKTIQELVDGIKDNDVIQDVICKDEDEIDSEYDDEFEADLELHTELDMTKEQFEEKLSELTCDGFELSQSFYDFSGIQSFEKAPFGYRITVSWESAK